MPTYVTLVKWTEQGIQKIKDLPDRLESAGKLMEAMGGKFTGTYITMGEYDMVVVSEGPSDEAATAAATRDCQAVAMCEPLRCARSRRRSSPTS